MNERRPRGYWPSLENTIKEAQEIMKKEKWEKLPSQKELQEKGYASLVSAVTLYHGGLQSFREQLGQENNRKSIGYCQSIDNIIKEAQEAMQKEGWEKLPSQKELQEKGYASLNNAISKHHGGLQSFREQLGQENNRKSIAYWQSLENTVREAQKVIQKEGWEMLPGARILREKGYASLAFAITKYHGGFPTFREQIGQENKTKLAGYWQSQENTVKEAQEAMKKERWKMLPGVMVLRENGYASLAFAITKYHGGYQKFRELLGQENNRKLMGYWPSLENTVKEAQEVMRKEGWETLPSASILGKNGYSSLANAIIRYHRGFPAFRELLRTHTNQPSESEQIKSLLEAYVNDT